MNIRELLERQAPWLVKSFNGVEWVSKQDNHERRLAALEDHIQDLETRYAGLENQLILHAQGQTHDPQGDPIPAPDID